MKDRRPVIVLAVFVLVLVIAGVALRVHSSSSDSAAPSDKASSTTSSSTSSTTAPTPAVDWQTQLNRVIAGENSLFSKPDPSKVGDYMVATCSCYSDTVTRITNLETHGWHVAGDAEKIGKSAYQSGSATTVTLVVQPQSAGNPTVDATGKVIETPSTTGVSQPFIYVLNKGSDGIWRIADRHLLPEQSQ